MLLHLCFASVVYGASIPTSPLPNWLDLTRETPSNLRVIPKESTPPPQSFRIPAEYEPASTVVVAYAGFKTLLDGIAKAAINYGNANVIAVQGPSSVQGADPSKYKVFDTKIDTVWTRDYGPFGIDMNSSSVGIVDTVYRHYQYRVRDDQFPSTLARWSNYPAYNAPIILDGGNFMVDSFGNLFMTKRTYLWNQDKSTAQVDSALKSYFNVKAVYSLEYAGYPGNPADGTGHIDMFVKLLNDHTVLIATATSEPFKSTAEKAISFFRSRNAPDGKPYKILTVDGWTTDSVWYTYTNSLIVNNVVIIPSYKGKIKEEQAAIAAYQQGITGIKVVPVPSDDSIIQGGSVHCVTQLIPAI